MVEQLEQRTQTIQPGLQPLPRGLDIVRRIAEKSGGAIITQPDLLKAQETIDLRVQTGNTATLQEVQRSARILAMHKHMPAIRRRNIEEGKGVMIDITGKIFPM